MHDRVGRVLTVTLKEFVPVSSCLPVAEQVTVVALSGNVEPDDGAQVAGRAPSMLSLAVAEKVTTAPRPRPPPRVMSWWER